MGAQVDEDFDFANFLAEFGKGTTNNVAGKRLREVVQACEKNGGKGKLTITFEIGVRGGMAELKAKVDSKRPEPALPGGMYFATDEGALVEEDPRQLKLPVPKAIDVQPLRTVGKDGAS